LDSSPPSESTSYLSSHDYFRPVNIILSDYKFLLLLAAKSAFACPAVLPGILSPIAAFYSS
jgi:hypothetical protein